MRKILALALLLGLVSPSLAQQVVQTIPAPGTTGAGNASSTIGTGGSTFQKVFSGANNSVAPTVGTAGARHGCTIQNNGTHTMYVTEGLGTAASTLTNSVQLAAGLAYYCGNPNGITLIGEIDITGTAGDAFYAAQF